MELYLKTTTKGFFGLGIGPKLKDFFLGTEDSAGFLGNFLGGGGNNKKSGGSSTGLAGLLQGLMGGGANNSGLFWRQWLRNNY